jgi:N4-gp56 family major capsid protein
MANVFTDTASGQNVLIQTAYDKAVAWELKDMTLFRQFATKRPELPTHNSSTVVLTIEKFKVVSTAPTALSETVDPDAAPAPTPSQVTVTFAEYGDRQISTLKLRKSALTAIDPIVAKQVAYHMAESMDFLYRSKLDALTNKLYVGTAGAFKTNVNAGALTDVTGNFGVVATRACNAILRGRVAIPWEGSDYMAIADPDVTFDLKGETGPGTWNDVHTYSGQVENIYAGEVGRLHGLRFVENVRCKQDEVNGAAKVVYTTYVMGRDSLVELVEIEPGVVVGVMQDSFRRFLPLGWYGLLGISTYRPECAELVKSLSTLAGIS